MYAIYAYPEEKGGAYASTLLIAIDPNTGEFIKSWYWGETLLTWFYNVHAFLAAGRGGETVVGIVGILSLVSLGTGIYLWWPQGALGRSTFLINLRAGLPRFEYDIHRLIGLYSLPIVAVICVTGVMIVFPAQIGRVVGLFSPVTDLHPHVRSGEARGAAAIPVSRAVAAARGVFPDAELKRIYTPEGEAGTYRIVLRQALERFNLSHTYTQVWVDQYSADVLHVVDPARFSAGTALMSYRLAFHNGEAFGLSGRVAVSMLGALLVLLYVAGIMQWLRRRGIQRQRTRTTR
jgi:uncharacterized iron-regulated membrane protein